MTTQCPLMCIESDPRSAEVAGSGVHHPAQGCQGRLHVGDTDLRSANDVSRIELSADRPDTTLSSAPERVAAPVARERWTPRDIAAFLIGASRRGEARCGNVALIKVDGQYVLYDLVTGYRTACTTANDVARAVEASVR
jgi:hypothetical protein